MQPQNQGFLFLFRWLPVPINPEPIYDFHGKLFGSPGCFSAAYQATASGFSALLLITYYPIVAELGRIASCRENGCKGEIVTMVAGSCRSLSIRHISATLRVTLERERVSRRKSRTSPAHLPRTLSLGTDEYRKPPPIFNFRT
jgi:hypothetical protein